MSLDAALLKRLDSIVTERGYPSRSQALADFIRRAVVKKEWKSARACAGVISLVVRPEEKNVLLQISRTAKANFSLVLSTQTFNLEAGAVFMVIAVKGSPAKLEKLADTLRGLKGISYGSFSITAPA